MEFFAEVATPGVEVEALREQLQVASLPSLCRSIDTVLAERHDGGEIYCVWGQFDVSREEIRNGVRFALRDCPHAFAWTVTYHEQRATLVVHATIDDREEDEEFVETIRQFVRDWGDGLGQAFAVNT